MINERDPPIPRAGRVTPWVGVAWIPGTMAPNASRCWRGIKASEFVSAVSTVLKNKTIFKKLFPYYLNKHLIALKRFNKILVCFESC